MLVRSGGKHTPRKSVSIKLTSRSVQEHIWTIDCKTSAANEFHQL